MRTELVVVGVERDNLHGEMMSHQKEAETLRVSLAEKADFVE